MDQPIEEGFDIKRSEKAIIKYLQSQNSTDSSIPQNSQIQDPYSIFQILLQQQEPCDFQNSMEYMIQSEISYTQSIDRL